MIVDGSATLSANVEIQKMLYKLRDLVPGIPQDRKLSKLEIMQCVIDYINDLEQVLETSGTVASAAGQQQQSKAHLLFSQQMVN